MQLNITTDYAVRILVYLGITGRVTVSGEIAEEMMIPANYVPNIIKKLRDKGLVNAKYGPKGGYELRQKPNEIPLLDVIETMEGAIRINRCDTGQDFCSKDVIIHDAVQDVYQDIQETIESTFATKSIADLIAKSKKEVNNTSV